MSEAVARVLTDILSDPNARLASFGPGSVLELPFAAAAKTGTSKGFRDNLTFGFTPKVTVAVWVGNFDGSPMKGVSGVTGAGPLFHAVMQAVHRHLGVEAQAFAPPDERFEYLDVCTLSGELPKPGCPHRHKELFLRGTAPERPCSMHEVIEVDRRNGLRAGPGCAQDEKRTGVFEKFEARYQAWAKASRRPLAPEDDSPHCPGHQAAVSSVGKLSIRYPYAGAVLLEDPSMPEAMQGLVVRVDAPASVKQMTLFVNGRAMATLGPPFEHPLRLSRGKHQLWVQAGEARSERVEFEVR
jgi:penicillin-binding protein 1C